MCWLEVSNVAKCSLSQRVKLINIQHLHTQSLLLLLYMLLYHTVLYYTYSYSLNYRTYSLHGSMHMNHKLGFQRAPRHDCIELYPPANGSVDQDLPHGEWLGRNTQYSNWQLLPHFKNICHSPWQAVRHFLVHTSNAISQYCCSCCCHDATECSRQRSSINSLALIQFVASFAGFCLTKKVNKANCAYLHASALLSRPLTALSLSHSFSAFPFINLFKFCLSRSNLTAACQLLLCWPPQQLQSNSELTR